MQRPPYDRELLAALDLIGLPGPSVTADMIPALRADPLATLTDHDFSTARVERRDVHLTSFDGATIVMSVLRPEGHKGTGPGFYHIHGGGMISGDRWLGTPMLFDWLHRFNAVAVTVEYRLAPENPDPTPVEDCFAGLKWTAAHARELNIDPSQLIIVGGSAGGGLAAGVTLLARDRNGPPVRGQMLMYPMLDDRDQTVSARQFEDTGLWDRRSNETGWTALLGERRGTADVSPYAAPARAEDLSQLPPTFIDCGSSEVFRDEDMAFASALWAAGGEAELHVWPGGYHSFEWIAPKADISRDMIAAREHWLTRVLGQRGRQRVS